MQINGNIQVYDGKKLITKGQNLITNVGKNIFLDWLSHNSYQQAVLYNQSRASKIYSGVSLSSERFIPNLTFNLEGSQQSVTGLNMFQSTSDAINIKNQTLYITLDQLRNISGIYINAKGSNTSLYYSNHVKIYYSTETVVQANQNNTWKLIKYVLNSYIDSSEQSASKMIRFDSMYTTDGYVAAKSFKLQFDGYGNENYILLLRGIGLLQKIPYPNVPCVIGLGIGKLEPKLTDVQLTSQACKLFVNKQLCNYQKTTVINGVQTTQFLKLDVNGKMPNELKESGINKINVVYVARINYNQYNNIQFNQIGLFFPSNQVSYQNGANSCTQMFSHGLFQEGWKKDSTQLIDIKYTISITV